MKEGCVLQKISCITFTRGGPPMLALADAEADGRVPCARCGRKFAPDRIAQHQYICSQLKRG